MRKITIELYANNEYALSERLKEIQWAITRTIWPSTCFSQKSRNDRSCDFLVCPTLFFA